MRLLRLLLVLPLSALAGWQSVVTVGGTPQDVQVLDGGRLLVASTGLSDAGVFVWSVSDAGVALVASLPGTNLVGGALLSDGCVVALASSGAIVSTAGCPYSGTAPGGFGNRFRLLSDLPQPWAAATVNNGTADTLTAGSLSGAGAWPSGVTFNNLASVRSLHTLHVGTADIALHAGGYLRIGVDGGPTALVDAGVGRSWRDAFPFVNPSGGLAAVGVTTTNTVVVLPDLDTPVAVQATLQGTLTPRYVAMGRRAGMLTSLAGVVYSPVPDPARVGETWVVRAGAPALSDRIDCLGDRFCAAVTAAGEVWWYSNDASPTLAVSVPATIQAGTAARLVADAGDADGDPVFVRWLIDGGTVVPVDGSGASVDLTVLPGACATEVTAWVSDGLESNDRFLTVPLPVQDRGALVLGGDAGVAFAGGAPVTLTALLDGGCFSPAYAWTSSTGQGGTGAQFSWSPPQTECNADGGSATITLTATWPSGTPATTQLSQTVSIVPWGAPLPPQFPSPGTQQSGTTQDWLSAGVEHVCGSAAGFPGTELRWSIDAGAATATPIDGGLRISAPLTCVGYRVEASATRGVAGDPAGRRSDAGVLAVDILPDLRPLDSSTPVALSADAGPGLIFVAVDAGASCLDVRALRSEITVSLDGGVLGSTTLGTPGSGSVAVLGGCAGGTFDVTARLFEDGGDTGAAATTQVTLPRTDAGIGALTVERLDVVCGEGARGTVALQPVADACQSATYTWQQVSGPGLVTAAGQGEQLSVETQALDYSIVGQAVSIDWTANGGVDNVARETRRLELGVQPFLEVSVRASPALRREEEPLRLEVILRNPTACEARGLSVLLPLSGATALPGTVRVDGLEPSAVVPDDQGIRLDGVTAPASGAVTVQLDVRPKLFGAPTVAPVASLSGYVVSTLATAPTPATGCGCSGGPGSVLACLGLLVLRRRRRTTR